MLYTLKLYSALHELCLRNLGKLFEIHNDSRKLMVKITTLTRASIVNMIR